MAEFGEQLRKAREAKGMTQQWDYSSGFPAKSGV